jgi:LytS/YehU family sensor histidine kinase
MYEDPRRADRMIASLSEFLRAVLRQESTHTVPLAEEMRLLEQYLAIMRVRFAERLQVQIDVPESLLDSPVPPLLLQPLVENCVQHGVDPASGVLSIEVHAEARDNMLRFEVRDHGQGLREARPNGLGLSNTRRRLERLYGDRQRMSLAAAQGGGTIAVVELPLEAAL